MRPTTLLLLMIVIFGIPDIGEGRNLLENLMHQAKTLQHGLALASTVGNIGSKYGRSVGFSAYQRTSRSYSSNHIVRFDGVRVNQGNGFNTASYKFTAPYGGLYVFSWTIKSVTGYNVYTSLMINGSPYQQSSCHGGNYGSSYRMYYQCSQTAVAWLSRNNYVWIRVDTSSTTFYSPYTTFSGWKV